MRSSAPFLLLLPLFLFSNPVSSKSVIEPCDSSTSCSSLLSYRLPYDSILSQISQRFQTNLTHLLAANAFDPAMPFPANQILPQNALVKVPISCPCVDGIRRSLATVYTVKAIDTVDSIAMGFGGLVSSQQIQTANGLSGSDRIKIGQSLVIPLPCACFNNSDNGVTVVYLLYVVGGGESLRSIGAVYGTTVTDLVAVNGLGNPLVYPGDILAIPIPACSSAYLNLNNENFLVPNGSYALTAYDCVQCTCGPKDVILRCSPSPFATNCKTFQCKGTCLLIGDVHEQTTKTGCSVATCLYRGYHGHSILSSISNTSQLRCSGDRNGSIFPFSKPPTLKQSTFAPEESVTPSPSSDLEPPLMAGAYEPASQQQSSNSVAGKASKHAALCLGLLIVEQAFLASIQYI